MHVDIHIPGAERIDALRLYIQRRLSSALGPDTDHARRASVRISEFSGPTRGMIMTSCRVEVEVASLPGSVVAEAYESNPYRAVDNAIERLSLSLHGGVRPTRTKPDVASAAPSRAPKARESWQSA